MSVKRKHVTLTLEQKCKILKELDRGDSVTKVASDYGIGKSTVCDIKKRRESILSASSQTECGTGNRKTLKCAEYPDVDKALYTWIVQERARHNIITGDLIAEKAKYFYAEILKKDDFRASKGWVDNFKKRHGIRYVFLFVCIHACLLVLTKPL
uniref:HTH CENPB-type domain-containing protein n=1 Tax=Clastoptera arizonana TaxID=38151 RepID=A0A1B6CZJ3_9HEMI